MVDKISTIAVDLENKQILDGVKVHPRETYNDILTRILKDKKIKEILKEK